MKRKGITMTLIAALAGVLCACTGTSGQGGQSAQDISQKEDTAVESYTVPSGWVRADAHSTEEKAFYVEEGHENDAKPDNFSVEYGTNRYAAADHEQFREAILRQLTAQAGAYNAALTGEALTTDAGDVLYAFTTDYGDSVGTQYYVVGEKRYCFFYATDFTGASVAANAALEAAKSFSWE